MHRAIRLPPLRIESETASDDVLNNINGNSISTNLRQRRESLLSSDPNTDSLPIDCILVYNINDDKKNNHGSSMSPSERTRKLFEECLVEKRGLILQYFECHSKRRAYVKVHTPFEILLLTAENIRMKLPIEKITEDEHDTSQPVKSRWRRFRMWFKRPFRLDPSITKGDPDYYTAIYSSNIKKFQDLFDTLRGSRDSYFTTSERSLLTYELLSRAHFGDDENDDHQQEPVRRKLGHLKRSGIDQLITKKSYECYFPLHTPLRDDVNDEDFNDREKLKKHWATMRQCFKFQPLSLIRSYMGEKIAFFFALFGYYNQVLIPASLIGLIVFIYGAASVFTDQPTSDICGNFGQNTYMCPTCDEICQFWNLSDSCTYSKVSYVFDNIATVVFAILMSLWARLCIEFWKRRQSVLQYEWDSIGFEGRLEPIRPDFENTTNEKRINPVTGINEPYISTRKRVPFFLIATAVVLLAMIIVCATVFGTVVYRVEMAYILQNTSVKTYSSIIITVTSAAMNLICSLVLSQLYYWIATKLTDLELHKYQSKYDNSLTIKIYLFQFVNFYSSLFYIAYFKGRFLEYPSEYGETGSKDFTEQCDPAGCFVELSIQLIIIMVGKQIINNCLNFFNAMLPTFIRICCNLGKHDKREQWEKDFDLYNFDSNLLINEYLELVIQFGFITLFVVAFPLAPLFALINNIIALRLDAWKFLSKYKRPIPFKASDIGIWSDIISAISYFSVLTNGLTIAWTSEFIPRMTYRVLESTGTDLTGYVNWTLSSFPISGYNLTGTVPSNIPPGLTYCRYRDFREPTPPYSYTSVYWNVLAARLAFIIVFENIIYLIIYIIQWLVPDVPKKIRNKIDHERYIDQNERWASETNEENFQHAINISKDAIIASQAVTKMVGFSSGNIKSPVESDRKSPNRKGHNRIGISPEDKQ